MVLWVLGVFSFETFGEEPAPADVRIAAATTFYASFDSGPDADFSQGDPRLYTLVRSKPEEAVQPGLPDGGATRIVSEQGLSGGALEMTARDAPWIFYKARRNVAYDESMWSGSVSVWLRLDPETDLDPGYCDPIQITTRAWNDAAFFIDFDKSGDPRDFRLGAFADLRVWNPGNKNVPEPERPLLTVTAPPFSRDRWTHVLFTWTGFNSGDREGAARLYLNGEPRGSIRGWDQTFTWAADEEPRLLVGLHYIGLIDELACFNRALTDPEAKRLHAIGMHGGMRGLLPAKKTPN